MIEELHMVLTFEFFKSWQDNLGWERVVLNEVLKGLRWNTAAHHCDPHPTRLDMYLHVSSSTKIRTGDDCFIPPLNLLHALQFAPSTIGHTSRFHSLKQEIRDAQRGVTR